MIPTVSTLPTAVQEVLNLDKDKYDFMTLDELKAACRLLEGRTDPIALYEVTNGMEGGGPVRVYVWAPSKARAMDLALESYQKYGFRDQDPKKLKIERLFFRGERYFATKPSDTGFDFPRPNY